MTQSEVLSHSAFVKRCGLSFFLLEAGVGDSSQKTFSLIPTTVVLGSRPDGHFH